MAEASSVELGFLEDVPAWKLHHRYFPSKVGGYPAWLDLETLPTPKDLQCPTCSEPRSFLLQMYAEDDDGDPTGASFHRTIFIFACRKSACMKPGISKCVLALRCGLPRINPFYGQVPAKEDPDATDPPIQHPLCSLCGCLAPNQCSSCKKTFYCGRQHQSLAWKNGHKVECAKIKEDTSVTRGADIKTSPVVFAEYELYAENEDLSISTPSKDEADSNAEYEKIVEKVKPSLNNVGADELEKYCSDTKDKVFKQFQKRISANPQQVLRYDRGGKPLLVSGKNVPGDKNIPKCECGAKRRFEFQIMPQILNYLQQEETLEEGLDFGTILVYTCSRNCHSDRKYLPEIVWVQIVEEESGNNDENDDEDD